MTRRECKSSLCVRAALLIAIASAWAAFGAVSASQASVRLVNNEYHGLVVGFSPNLESQLQRETLVREMQVSKRTQTTRLRAMRFAFRIVFAACVLKWGNTRCSPFESHRLTRNSPSLSAETRTKVSGAKNSATQNVHRARCMSMTRY